ncbi:hypothetical protein GCM10027594_32480 [Hymenobacter agri]
MLMHNDITPELVHQANLLARSYNDFHYCTLHSVLGHFPAQGQYPGGWHEARAVRLWLHQTDAPAIYLLYVEHRGSDEELLQALSDDLCQWHLSGTLPSDVATVTESAADALIALAQHPLTTATDRAELLRTQIRLMSGRQAREATADLTAKLEARSPGVLTGRGWMPHGEPVPRQGPHPFAYAA